MPTIFVRLASTPVTKTSLPWTLASAERISETASTPGTFASAVAALFVSGLAVGGRDGVVGDEQLVDRARERGAEALAETATKVISARPIITAAAVEAVRDGLRTAFWRASRPAVPPSSRPGAPST